VFKLKFIAVATTNCEHLFPSGSIDDDK